MRAMGGHVGLLPQSLSQSLVRQNGCDTHTPPHNLDDIAHDPAVPCLSAWLPYPRPARCVMYHIYDLACAAWNPGFRGSWTSPRVCWLVEKHD